MMRVGLLLLCSLLYLSYLIRFVSSQPPLPIPTSGPTTSSPTTNSNNGYSYGGNQGFNLGVPSFQPPFSGPVQAPWGLNSGGGSSSSNNGVGGIPSTNSNQPCSFDQLIGICNNFYQFNHQQLYQDTTNWECFGQKKTLIIPGKNKFTLVDQKFGGLRTFWLYIPSCYQKKCLVPKGTNCPSDNSCNLYCDGPSQEVDYDFGPNLPIDTGLYDSFGTLLANNTFTVNVTEMNVLSQQFNMMFGNLLDDNGNEEVPILPSPNVDGVTGTTAAIPQVPINPQSSTCYKKCCCNSDCKIPLVIFIHGIGGHEDDADRLIKYAEEKCFMILSATGTPSKCPFSKGLRAWGSGDSCCTCNPNVDDEYFHLSILDFLKDIVCIRRDRIFLLGVSNGAMFGNHMACKHTDLYRGMIDVLGVTNLGQGNLLGLNSCKGYMKPQSPLSILKIHGTSDIFVPWLGCSPLGFPGISNDWHFWQSGMGCSGTGTNTWTQGSASNLFFDKCNNGSIQDYVTIQNGGHEWYSNSDFDTDTYIMNWLDTVNALP